jgi:hypothetical protein
MKKRLKRDTVRWVADKFEPLPHGWRIRVRVMFLSDAIRVDAVLR